MSDPRAACPECGGVEFYEADVPAQSATFNLLPGLNTVGATLHARVCAACGAMRLYVPPVHRAGLERSKPWKRFAPTDDAR